MIINNLTFLSHFPLHFFHHHSLTMGFSDECNEILFKRWKLEFLSGRKREIERERDREFGRKDGAKGDGKRVNVSWDSSSFLALCVNLLLNFYLLFSWHPLPSLSSFYCLILPYPSFVSTRTHLHPSFDPFGIKTIENEAWWLISFSSLQGATFTSR